MTDPEMAAALVGALVGAGGTALAGLLAWVLTEISTSRRAVRASRVALAREVVRNRGNQALVAVALNEIPVVFGHDEELLRLYRQFLDGKRKDDALLDIVVRMSKVARINRKVTASDLRGYLSITP